MIRRTLPQRRAAETFDLRFWNQLFTVTVGFYPDGTLGEVFIDGGKSGQDVQSTARDAAVVLSLALLHGTPIEMIRHAVTRGTSEEPASILGAVVDSITTKSFSGVMGADRKDFSDKPNWQPPQEPPDPRRVGIVALDTEMRPPLDDVRSRTARAMAATNSILQIISDAELETDLPAGELHLRLCRFLHDEFDDIEATIAAYQRGGSDD